MATAEHLRQIHAERNRTPKVQTAVDVILYAYAAAKLPTPSPDDIDGLDADGWAALEQLVTRVRGRVSELQTAETREAVPAAYRARWETRVALAAMTEKELFDV